MSSPEHLITTIHPTVPFAALPGKENTINLFLCLLISTCLLCSRGTKKICSKSYLITMGRRKLMLLVAGFVKMLDLRWIVFL
jgi:hypothetical protein